MFRASEIWKMAWSLQGPIGNIGTKALYKKCLRQEAVLVDQIHLSFYDLN
jgi:hypothetical protein